MIIEQLTICKTKLKLCLFDKSRFQRLYTAFTNEKFLIIFLRDNYYKDKWHNSF